MTSLLSHRPGLLGLLLLLTCSSSWAHDLMASYVIARLLPDHMELQIKIAAESAWPLVQEISPGAVFTMEEFESRWRPLLLSCAKTMDQVTIDGKIVPPVQMDVVVAEDTFLFAFAYSLPLRGAMQIKETYLKKMSPEYASHIRLFDQAGTLIESKDLTGSNLAFDIVLPLANPGTSPRVNDESSAKTITKP